MDIDNDMQTFNNQLIINKYNDIRYNLSIFGI